MSDLDRRISEWRLSLEPQLGAQAVDELEDHLRNLFDSLGATGLPESERWLIAMHRLGQPQPLAVEFRKNGCGARWRDQLLWLALEVALLNLWMVIVWHLEFRIAFAIVSWQLPSAATVGIASIAGWAILIAGIVLWIGSSGFSPRSKLQRRLTQPTRLIWLVSLLGVTLVCGPVLSPVINFDLIDHSNDYWRVYTYIQNSLPSNILNRVCLFIIGGLVAVWVISGRFGNRATWIAA